MLLNIKCVLSTSDEPVIYVQCNTTEWMGTAMGPGRDGGSGGRGNCGSYVKWKKEFKKILSKSQAQLKPLESSSDAYKMESENVNKFRENRETVTQGLNMHEHGSWLYPRRPGNSYWWEYETRV